MRASGFLRDMEPPAVTQPAELGTHLPEHVPPCMVEMRWADTKVVARFNQESRSSDKFTVVKQVQREARMLLRRPGLGPVIVTREAHRDNASLRSNQKARLGEHTPTA